MSRRGAVRMSRRRVKVANLGFVTIGDSTPEESVIARLYAIPKDRRRAVMHDLADRYSLGMRDHGLIGYYDYIETLLEAVEAQHLEMDGLEEPTPTTVVPGRRMRLASPPIPPLNCTHTMIRGPRRGVLCGKVSVGVEAGRSVCFHHTRRNVEYQRERGRKWSAVRRARMREGGDG